MAKIIDGKQISKDIKEELKQEVAELASQGRKCCLAVIQVGNDPASSVYVGNKTLLSNHECSHVLSMESIHILLR